MDAATRPCSTRGAGAGVGRPGRDHRPPGRLRRPGRPAVRVPARVRREELQRPRAVGRVRRPGPDRCAMTAADRLPAPRLLFVHAHPDDETLTTGLTMAHYAAAGCDVHVLTCTLGGGGRGDPPHGFPHLASGNKDEPGGRTASRSCGRRWVVSASPTPCSGRTLPLVSLPVTVTPAWRARRAPRTRARSSTPTPTRRRVWWPQHIERPAPRRRGDVRRARGLRPPRPHPNARGHHGGTAAAGGPSGRRRRTSC